MNSYPGKNKNGNFRIKPPNLGGILRIIRTKKRVNSHIMKLQTTIFFVLISVISFGQVNKQVLYNPDDYPEAKYSVKIDTFSLKIFKIELVQAKLKDVKTLDADSIHCRIWLTVKSGNTVLDKLFYPDCLGLGGCSGVYADGQPNKEYIILSKLGDYTGQLIIIDKTGKIQTYSGGYYFVSDNSRYLFSILNSDGFGLSVFDLLKNKLIFSTDTLKNELGDFYIADNKSFVVEIEDVKKEKKTNILTFDYNKNSLIKSTVDDKYIQKAKKLRIYNFDGPCHCGQK